MKIEVDISKKYFFGLLLIGLILVGLVGVVAYNLEITSSSGNPPIFGHSVDEMDWSKTIQKNVSAVGFCIGGDCKTSWAQVGGGGGGSSGLSSQWNNSGNDIYYNKGKVGIGTSSPITTLSVAGTIGTEEYANLGEDNYGGLSPVNTGNEDNCNGNRDQQYSCNVTESRTCVDIVGGQKRTITCVGRVYGSRMNSTGIYTSGRAEIGGGLKVGGQLNISSSSFILGPVKISYVAGTNPECPSGASPLSKKWSAKTCTAPTTYCSSYNYVASCTISGWGEPSCTYYVRSSGGIYGACTATTCQFISTDAWTEALCIGNA